MGYCIELSKSTLVIKKDKVEDVMKSLKQLARENINLRWINKNSIIGADTIEEIFEEIRYELVTNEGGDYEIDYFAGEKLGNDHEIFNSFAKYIDDGQYIEMHGEDDRQWRWVFRNGKCEEIYPTITWEY